MKARVLVPVLLLATSFGFAGPDARDSTEEIQKKIQAASAALLEPTASEDEIRSALIQLLDAAVLTLPKSEHAADAKSNLEAARVELTAHALLSEKGYQHLALAYRALSGGNQFQFPDIHTIEEAKVRIRNLLATSVASLRKGQEGPTSRSLLECVIIVLTPMSR